MLVCVSGGDGRMDHAARALQKEGYEVVRTQDGCVSDADVLVLPPRCSLPHEQLQLLLGRGTCIVGGGLGVTGRLCFDYMKDEAFLYENARITAEGATVLLGKTSDGTVYGMDVGVLGMGRIAECLCRMLCALDARVTVYARRPEALARACALGACTGLLTRELPASLFGHDAICNTVPHLLLDADAIPRLRSDVLLLELASAPGGFDRDAAAACGLCITDGRGLPGKYAPRAAGELIADFAIEALKGERA